MSQPTAKHLQAPILNRNGTPASHLREAYANALTAIRDAQTALGETYPHGRDFQTETTGLAMRRAQTQHTERLAKLQNIVTELEALAADIDAQESALQTIPHA